MEKVVVLGCGKMGRAAAYDLVNNCRSIKEIKIVDEKAKTLSSIKLWLDSEKVITALFNAKDEDSIANAIRGYDAALSCIPYISNYRLTKVAIENGVHFGDLGGNNDVVKKQLTLDKLAKEKNVLVIPDLGLTPGLSSVFTKKLYEEFDRLDEIILCDGGLPQNVDKDDPLKYASFFHVDGLINEYIEPCITLKDYEIQKSKNILELINNNFHTFLSLYL